MSNNNMFPPGSSAYPQQTAAYYPQHTAPLMPSTHDDPVLSRVDKYVSPTAAAIYVCTFANPGAFILDNGISSAKPRSSPGSRIRCTCTYMRSNMVPMSMGMAREVRGLMSHCQRQSTRRRSTTMAAARRG